MRDFYRAAGNKPAVPVTAASVSQEESPVFTTPFSSRETELLEALARTETARQLAERGRGAFLSAMSHELRTPLNAIMGFADMMRSGVFGPLDNKTYEEYVTHIHDSGNALLSKINDLLDIASMDGGDFGLEETRFALRPVLDELVEMYSHPAFSRQLNLKIDCPVQVELQGDRSKLLCAISHFVSNALRHSKENGDITISARLQKGSGLVLSVRDDGEGIPPSQLALMHKALAAEADCAAIESGGLGIGLALARELAQRHGGRIILDSIRHRGTVISLLLPESRILSGLPARKRHLV